MKNNDTFLDFGQHHILVILMGLPSQRTVFLGDMPVHHGHFPFHHNHSAPPSDMRTKLFGGCCRSISSKAWLNRHKNDAFVKLAAKEDMRSRSAFKLIELQEKFRFIRHNDYVVDLGSAPGGWSLATSRILSSSGLLCSIDLLPMEPIEEAGIDAHFFQGNFQSKEVQEHVRTLGISKRRNFVDVVISDMLGNSSGNHAQDHFRSMDLCRTALGFCVGNLRPTGHFVAKYLRGSDEVELIGLMRRLFIDVRVVKPKASRSESSEMYVLARHKRKAKSDDDDDDDDDEDNYC